MINKPGRNELCPCGSGKKFKRCHGDFRQIRPEPPPPLFLGLGKRAETMRARMMALEHQRMEQQGLGRPIVSEAVNDQRVVAVNNKIYTSNNWHTFHDFLRDYPRMVLGDEWFLAEVQKSESDRHLIAKWYMRAAQQAAERRKGMSAPGEQLPTGALSAYMRLAYDLYSLQHSVKVEELLLERIKSPRGFPGALYEVRVAASLIRAGFTLELEDETDRRTTHVEFVATHPKTGSKYSVEAKRREGRRLKLNKLLHNALAKHADHPRIVFVDTNDDRLDMHKYEGLPQPLAEARHQLNLYALDPGSQGLPAAYVISTWAPEEHHLDSTGLPFGLLLLGFRIDDLAPGLRNLFEQVQIRRRHTAIFELIESMVKHQKIPTTFDGAPSAYARGAPQQGLLVGERYQVSGPDGIPVVAILEGGVVLQEQRAAVCNFLGPDGGRFFSEVPLSDAELQAYLEHPSTFFGKLDRSAGRKPLETAIECFDFLWENYKDTRKKLLLDWLKPAPDFDSLAHLSQEDLATHYCVRMAQNMMRSSQKSQG